MPDGQDDTRDIRVDGNSTRLTTATLQGDAGEVTVPAKPTAEMLAAGTRAGNVSVEAAWRVYRAMLAEANRLAANGVPADRIRLAASQPPRVAQHNR